MRTGLREVLIEWPLPWRSTVSRRPQSGRHPFGIQGAAGPRIERRQRRWRLVVAEAGDRARTKGRQTRHRSGSRCGFLVAADGDCDLLAGVAESGLVVRVTAAGLALIGAGYAIGLGSQPTDVTSWVGCLFAHAHSNTGRKSERRNVLGIADLVWCAVDVSGGVTGVAPANRVALVLRGHGCTYVAIYKAALVRGLVHVEVGRAVGRPTRTGTATGVGNHSGTVQVLSAGVCRTLVAGIVASDHASHFIVHVARLPAARDARLARATLAS